MGMLAHTVRTAVSNSRIFGWRQGLNAMRSYVYHDPFRDETDTPTGESAYVRETPTKGKLFAQLV